MTWVPRFLSGRVSARSLRGYLDPGKVVGGNIARALLRGLFKLLVAGFLAPQALGILRSVYSFFKIVTSLVDLGLDYAAVTFVAAAIRKGDGGERRRTFETVLGLKLLIVAVLLVVGNLFAMRITSWAFGDPGLTLYTRLVFFAVGGQLLWKYVHGYLAAHQDFGKIVFFLTTVPLIMLGSAAMLIVADLFSLRAGVLIYLFAPAAAVLLWWPVLGSRFVRRPALDGITARRVIRFSRWIYLSNVSSATRGHLNTLMLKSPRLSGSLAAGELNAGLYSFGNDLANEITVLSQSMLTVLLPKASSKSNPDKLRRFVRRAYGHLALLIVPLFLLVFAAEPAIVLLGHIRESYLDYLPSVRVFGILYCGSLFSIVALPMKTALYAINLPQIETYLEWATIPLLIGGAIWLIPRFGTEGAAIVVFAQRTVTSVSLVIYGSVQLRRLESL